MVLDIINKILTILLFMSGLNALWHLYFFIQISLIASEDNPIKYRLTNKSLFLLGLSLAYILTAIFAGIKI